MEIISCASYNQNLIEVLQFIKDNNRVVDSINEVRGNLGHLIRLDIYYEEHE